MNGRWLSALLLASPLCWGWSTTAPSLTPHQPPMRTISLPTTLNATEWAASQNLSAFNVIHSDGERQWLSFRTDDARWQQLHSQCQNNNPLAPHCNNDSCQSVRNPLPTTTATNSTTWLIPRPPDLTAFLTEQPDSCPHGLAATPWQGAVPSGEDPACWSVQQLNPCRSEQTPAEYLQPHWRPNQLVVALPANNLDSQQWASDQGLVLLEETLLNSTGDRLLRLLRPNDHPISLDGWVELLKEDDNTLEAQKDLAYFTLATHHATLDQPRTDAPTQPPGSATTTDDPLQPLNYGPALSQADQLTPRFDGQGVAVAVIDTGIDRQHPELLQRVVQSHDFTEQGYSADAHGTAVAAIIAAARHNGVGASGLAPAISLHSYKACHPRVPGGLAAQCWSSSLIKALDHAISSNLPVINMSLGGPPSPLLERLVRTAHQRGLLVLAAAGNGGPNARPIYPAAWPEALAVTAVDPDLNLYPQANRGSYIQLAAPGVDIITAAPDNGQPLLSGTSMATAHTSGVAALLLQINPVYTPQGLIPRLQQYSLDLGQPGADDQFGAGLLNACATALALGASELVCGGAP